MKNALRKTLLLTTLSLATTGVMAMGEKAAEQLSPDPYASLINQPLNLGEQFTLRTYTGQALGLALTNQLNIKRLGVVQNTSSICTSLAASIGGEVVAHNRDNNVYSAVAVNSADDIANNKAKLLDKDAVALVFGGQTPPEQNYALVKATLSELAQASYEGAIVYHVAVWMPKMIEKVAAEDAQVKAYLTHKPNMFALTIDAKQAKMQLHHVALSDDGQQASVEVLYETDMNDSWLNLFKRSLIARN